MHPSIITVDPLSDLIAWVATCGAAGLLGVTLIERLLPILPSYGLLVAIGIAAAGGALGRCKGRNPVRSDCTAADQL